ncbi:MAG: hypothetical protein BRC41_02410 [Cyanobacteria bacterium QH_9_48_43]|nr:MAG: hypothetical protein BRC41_02410 [Cyanobacteria bacterium QH_9_48_43]
MHRMGASCYFPSGLSSHQVIMDRAYEGNEARQLLQELEMTPVVPPKRNRLAPWDYDPKIMGLKPLPLGSPVIYITSKYGWAIPKKAR